MTTDARPWRPHLCAPLQGERGCATIPAMTIVPRWEWRTFGSELGDAERQLAALDAERTQESDEVYVLSSASDASVKLRDEQIDVKTLQAVDADGLEQWKPVLKAAFPLTAADAQFVLSTLGLAEQPIGGSSTLDELLASAGPGALAVPVHKRRVHYLVDGCMAELSDLQTGHGTIRTIALESEDPERVSAATRKLGLGGRPNTCVARGLKALVGFGARRFAVIDVGTNSVKFHVGEQGADGEWRTIVDRAEVTRLGEGLDRTGQLNPAAIERTAAAIAGMAEEARGEGAEAIAAVGTAGMRIAPNASELIDAVRTSCDVQVEVLPAEEEARLAYVAVKAALGFDAGSLVVFDTGGGSSQFTFGDGERIDERFSVNVGAARFTERFGLDGPVSTDTLAEAFAAIEADLDRLAGRPTPDSIVGMGGAVTNLAAVKHALETYDPSRIQGTRLDRADIERQIERYRTSTASERREIVGLQPNRAEVILAGACIVRTVLTMLGRDAFTVSDRGLRHGLIVERFGSRAAA
jgi:exopolyphosphatase/guanosine-5'-triphosphate,3'-diphosphate pyrophosphatase